MSTLSDRLRISDSMQVSFLYGMEIFVTHLSPLAFAWAKLLGWTTYPWWALLPLIGWRFVFDAIMYSDLKALREWLEDDGEDFDECGGRR